MTTEDYVSYPIALALKKAGFDEPCIAHWACEPDGKPMLIGSTAFMFNNAELKGRDVTAPLIYQAQKWLRDKKGVLLWVYPDSQPIDEEYSEIELTGEWWWEIDGSVREGSGDTYPSYESALSAGIAAALELIEKKGE